MVINKYLYFLPKVKCVFFFLVFFFVESISFSLLCMENEFVFSHEMYTLCTDDENVEATFIKKITQGDLKMLLCSSVIKNSLKIYDCKEKKVCEIPEIIVVPQFMNESYLKSFLDTFRSFQARIGMSFPQKTWYLLFTYYNQLGLESEDLKKHLIAHCKDIFEYSWSHRITLESHPDLLNSMREVQLEKSYDLAMLLISRGTQQLARKQMISVPLDQQIQYVTMSKNDKKILCVTDTSAHIYVINSKSRLEHLYEIEGILCGGLSPDGSTVVVARFIEKGVYDLEWYEFIENGLRKKRSFQFKENAGEVDHRNPCGLSPFIHLSNDGRRGLLKFNKLDPLFFFLDSNEEECMKTEFAPKLPPFGSFSYNYDTLFAMNSNNKVAYKINKRRDLSKYWSYVIIDNTDNFDPEDYSFSYDTVSGLSLDENGNSFLCVNDKGAYLCSVKGKYKSRLSNDNCKIREGALSSDGNVAVLGESYGNLHFYMPSLFGKSITYPLKNSMQTGDPILVSLATNHRGNKVVLARKNNTLEYIKVPLAQDLLNDIFNNLDQYAVSTLSKVAEQQKKHKDSPEKFPLKRPTNISNFYSKLPEWMKPIIKRNLNVRTGWGPQATWDVITSKTITTRYKIEAIAPYVVGATALTIGSYYAFSKWLK